MNEREKAISEAFVNIGDHAKGDPTTFFVSELPFCRRKMIFTRHFDMRIPANAKMVTGTIFHTAIPEIVGKTGKQYDGYEMKYEIEAVFDLKDFKVVGHCDVLCQHDGKGTNKPDIVEEWKFSRSAMRPGETMPIYYLAQANVYATMLKAKRYRIVVVNPEDLQVSVLEGDKNEEAAEKMLDRAGEVFKVFRDADHPLCLMPRDYNAVKKKAKEAYLRPLLDEVVSKLPEGPEYEFECKTRSSECPFYSICKGGS